MTWFSAATRGSAIRSAACLLGTALLTSGCAVSFQDLPVGRTVSGSSYDITALFTDAAQLPVGGQVMLGAATVGRVQSIATRNFQAVVTLNIADGTKLPAGTTASLALTSALGEEYVQLQPPAHPGARLMRDGSVIPVADTSRGPDLEDTIAALGAVLNGSGLSQIRTIVTEMNTALGGREQEVRDLLARLDSLLATLNAHRADINSTLDALDVLSKETASNTALLNQALTKVTPAVQSLAGQTKSFNALLKQVPALSTAANNLVNQAGPALDTQLNQLEPVMTSLSGFDDRLSETLTALNTFEGRIKEAIPGDYLKLNGTLDVSRSVEKLLTGTDPSSVLGTSSAGTASSGSSSSAQTPGGTSLGNTLSIILGGGTK